MAATPWLEQSCVHELRFRRAQSFPASEQFVTCVSGRFGWIFLHLQPWPKVECVYANAKHIRRDKAVLRRVQCDHTDHETVDARNNKPGPHLPSEQDRGDDGEKTR